MATAGDVPTFRPGIQNPAADLNDLARRVGMLEALRVLPPLEYRLTPAGALISLQESTASQGTFSGARVYTSAPVTIGTSPTTIFFDTERFDVGAPGNGYHDSSYGNNRLIIPSDGYYLIGAELYWQSSPGIGEGVLTVIRTENNEAIAATTAIQDQHVFICQSLSGLWKWTGTTPPAQNVTLQSSLTGLVGSATVLAEFWIQKVGT